MPRNWKAFRPDWWNEKRIWVIRSPQHLKDGSFRIPLLRRILLSRGLKTEKEQDAFLQTSYSGADEENPSVMRAVHALADAIETGQTVLVHGDYDADGICASALLVWTLSRLGLKTLIFLPSRYRQGYGVRPEMVRQAHRRGIDFLITVDCGTTCREAMEEADRSGMKVVIVDHHQPGPEQPPCLVHLNPKAVPDDWHFTSYSAGGLALVLCRALLRTMGRQDLYQQLPIELAGLATVADMVPLAGENRGIVRKSLEFLKDGRHLGLSALMEEAAVRRANLTSWHLAYILGPRINAAGRMGDPKPALHLLLSQSHRDAAEWARYLNSQNQKRQREEQGALEQAVTLAGKGLSDFALIVRSPEDQGKPWSPGVIGIIAARLVELFYRPAFVITFLNGKGLGSARGVEGFSVAQALHLCRDYLISGGGHDMAGGFQIESDQIVPFARALTTYCSQVLTEETLTRKISIDAEASLDDLTLSSLAPLDQLEPTGCGNPKPVLWLKGVRIISCWTKGCRDILIVDKEGRQLEVTGEHLWAAVNREPSGSRWHLCVSPETPSGSDTRRRELKVLDLCPVHSSKVSIKIVM